MGRFLISALRFKPIWALADQFVVSGAGFLTTLLFAREMGVAEFGRFSLVWLSILLATSVQTAVLVLPMMSIGPKHAAGTEGPYYALLTAQQIVLALGASALYAVAYGAIDLVAPQFGGLVAPVAACVVCVLFQEYVRRSLFARGRAVWAFTNDVVRYGFQVALVYLVARPTVTVPEALWILAVSGLVAALVGGVFVEPPRFAWAEQKPLVRRHWSMGRWLLGSTIIAWGSSNLVYVLAGALTTVSTVGAMRAANNLMGLTSAYTLALQNVVPSQAAMHYEAAGPARLKRYLLAAAVAITGPVALVAAAVAVEPERLIILVYGREYAGYGYMLVWLAVVYTIASLELPFSSGLRAMENTSYDFIAYVMGLVLMLALVYPLFLLFGIPGILMSMALIWLVRNTVMYVGFTRLLARYKDPAAAARPGPKARGTD